MRKIILGTLFAVLCISCKPSQSVTNTKIDDKTQVAIKGDWKITKVSFVGDEVMKVTSFDVADSKCFEGSVWRFISMSNKGTMLLAQKGCPEYSSPITWFVNKEGQFVFKILDAAKAKTVKNGYVLRISNQTANSFQLVDKVMIGKNEADVVYQFEKLK